MSVLRQIVSAFGFRRVISLCRDLAQLFIAKKSGTAWTRLIPQHSLKPELSDSQILRSIEFVSFATKVDLSDISIRSLSKSHLEYLNFWPGEHYKLLRGVSEVMKPKLVVEIGTWVGMSALALSKFAEKTITYDVRQWDSFKKTFLLAEDFEHKIEQRVGNLLEDKFFNLQIEIFKDADLIFLDAPKDGNFEQKLLSKILPLLKSESILILDDIKFINMLDIWEKLEFPRIDLSSFGHSSGTGIVFIP